MHRSQVRNKKNEIDMRITTRDEGRRSESSHYSRLTSTVCHCLMIVRRGIAIRVLQARVMRDVRYDRYAVGRVLLSCYLYHLMFNTLVSLSLFPAFFSLILITLSYSQFSQLNVSCSAHCVCVSHSLSFSTTLCNL